MAKINNTKISEKIYKQLDKKGLLKELKILRVDKNAFGEKQKDLYVCTIKGFCYRKENKINISTTEGATVSINYNERLLVVCNEESIKIKQDDYFILENIKFKIIDKGNAEDIIFDMTIKRM